MGRKNPEPFTIAIHVDSTHGEFSWGEEKKPPTTAKLVATISWSWSPANSRCDRYLICSDRKRIAWRLWAMEHFDGTRMYAQIASGTPVAGYTARFAAKELLIAAWRSEFEKWGKDLGRCIVDEEGLLTESDIRRIEQEYTTAAH
jgi:hypothetical protein